MTRMVQSYMREEELRSRHQTALLQLRQTALEEKTRAELGWLRLKKQQLVNRGADDLMPPLKRREKGLLRQLQHEQVGGAGGVGFLYYMYMYNFFIQVYTTCCIMFMYVYNVGPIINLAHAGARL